MNTQFSGITGTMLKSNYSAPTAGSSGAAFADILASTNSSNSSSGSSSVGASSSSSAALNNATKKPDAVSEFMKYMKEPESQRMLDSYLSAHNITPEQFAAMTDAQKEKIITQIQQEMKSQIQQATQDKAFKAID